MLGSSPCNVGTRPTTKCSLMPFMGGKRKALKAAIAYRDALLNQHSTLEHQLWVRTRLRKNNTSGIPGVCRYERASVASKSTELRFACWLAGVLGERTRSKPSTQVRGFSSWRASSQSTGHRRACTPIEGCVQHQSGPPIQPSIRRGPLSRWLAGGGLQVPQRIHQLKVAGWRKHPARMRSQG
jgi:hypothetical protein